MSILGKSIKLGDNINTDFIISGRYKFAITDLMIDLKPSMTSEEYLGQVQQTELHQDSGEVLYLANKVRA